MTTYTWPTSRHFVPAAHELRVVDNTQRTVESSLSGYVQTNAMPGARWGWGMDFTAHTQAQRAEVEAYLLRLSGRQHRVQLWDLRNPRPRGNIRLTGVTLGATAAQFATSLTLAGCYPASNLIPYPGSFDNAAWSKVGGSITANALAAPDGTTSGELFTEDGTSGGHYIAQAAVAFVAGTAYTFSVHVKADVGVRYACLLLPIAAFGSNKGIVVNSTTGAIVTNTGGLTAAVSDAGNGWWRAAITATATVSATSFLQIRSQSVTGFANNHAGDGVSTLGLWGAQMDVGELSAYVGAATLLAGDWLGVPNGQLLRVVANAAATEAGAMTVEVRHMLRAAVSSGAAVTLDKPAALYVRTEAGLALPRQPGNVDPGLSLDLVEVFA